MDSSPDFNSYTLEELLDVKKVVDPVKYPERAEAINTAISQKIAPSRRTCLNGGTG